VTAGAAVSASADDTPAALSFARARCSRAPGGGFAVDYSDPFFQRLLGSELADHLTTPAAADLAAALDAVLARVEKTRVAAEIEIGPVDPSGRDRRLRARIRGQWSRGSASANVVLDEPGWSEVDPAGDIARAQPPRAAVVHAERGEDDRLHLEFVDDAIGDLVGIPAERLVDTPAAAVILARAETVLASTYPVGNRICELAIADPTWGGRPLTCRFFRGGTDGGRPSVSLLVYGPGPGKPPCGGKPGIAMRCCACCVFRRCCSSTRRRRRDWSGSPRRSLARPALAR
jgi:hypothetical protein